MQATHLLLCTAIPVTICICHVLIVTDRTKLLILILLLLLLLLRDVICCLNHLPFLMRLLKLHRLSCTASACTRCACHNLTTTTCCCCCYLSCWQLHCGHVDVLVNIIA
jgi:hypothetical protein